MVSLVMSVAVFLTEICAPEIAPPDASVMMPERVAPVTCEYIETASDRLKMITIKIDFRRDAARKKTPPIVVL